MISFQIPGLCITTLTQKERNLPQLTRFPKGLGELTILLFPGRSVLLARIHHLLHLAMKARGPKEERKDIRSKEKRR